MSNKKIAVIVYHFQDKNFYGGGEKIMFNLVKTLCTKQMNVDLFCVETNTEKKHGLNNIFYISPSEYYNQASLLRKNNEYDSVITENINSSGDVTIAMGHTIAYRQNIVRSKIEKAFSKSKNEQIKHQIHNINNYSAIIALSSVAKNDYIKFLKVSEDKIQIAHPGVDIPENTTESNNSIYTFGLSAPGFDRKGGYILLNALRYLNKQSIDYRVKIICPTAKENKSVKFLLWLHGVKNKVEFIDLQEDMNKFYELIDCLILPSKEETFGMVATEAIANKRLVIASSRCGASDIIIEKENGFVFSIDGNPSKNLAKKMKYVLENKATLNHLIDNGYETAKKYSWSNFCDSVLKLIKKMEEQ